MATQNKSLNQPAYNSVSWDVPLNNNFGYIDAALGSTYLNSDIGGTVSLASSQYQCMRLRFNGSLTSDLVATIPNLVGGTWIVTNNTTDQSPTSIYKLTIKTSAVGSVGVNPPRGSTVVIFSDGTNVGYAVPFTLPGTIIQYAGVSAPSGYLACDGSSVSRSTYSALWDAIGTAWGTPASSTTFYLPDLRGMFLRGTGANGTGSSSGAIGPAVGTYAADTYLNHSHGVTDPGHTHTSYQGSSFLSGGGQSQANLSATVGGFYFLAATTATANTGISINTSTTGGTETKPKNYGVLMCIKT